MGKRSIISGLLIAASLLLAIGCDMGGSDDGGATTYAIGDTGPAGGLIFYIDVADAYDWTYLEVAPQSTEWRLKVWGGYETAVTGADGTAIGTGAQNTIDIVTQFGPAEPYESRTDYAARLCSDLASGGYDDWFLPSKDELNAIWDNLVDDGTGSNSGVGGFADDYYWSSSEDDSYLAWCQNFYDGFQTNLSKNSCLLVRAVRAF
jgi:hypothetical protein